MEIMWHLHNKLFSNGKSLKVIRTVNDKVLCTDVKVIYSIIIRLYVYKAVDFVYINYYTFTCCERRG